MKKSNNKKIKGILHITNGDSLTNRLSELEIEGVFITWREMLCEGPTDVNVFSKNFISVRANYLIKDQDKSPSPYDKFVTQFEKFDPSLYDSVYLWFEYDLFCHVNLSAVCSYLTSFENLPPILLVCSGTIIGEERLLGLSELNRGQLYEHYHQAVELTKTHLDTLSQFWDIYNSEDHNKLKLLPKDPNTLPYLDHCIKAQLQRFPKVGNGLNWIEHQILDSIHHHNFTSERQLIGHILRNQSYYGFGDLQIEASINRLKIFFTNKSNFFALTSLGLSILNSNESGHMHLKETTPFGGAFKYDYFYDARLNKLIPVHENS